MRASAILVAFVLFGLVAAQTQPTQTFGQYTVVTVYNGTNCQGPPIAISAINNDVAGYDTCVVFPCQVDGLFQNTVANLNANAFVTSSKTSCTNSPFVSGEIAPLTVEQQSANPPVAPYLARVSYGSPLTSFDAGKFQGNTLACSGIASSANIAPIQNYGACIPFNYTIAFNNVVLQYYKESCAGSTYTAAYYTDLACSTPAAAPTPITGCANSVAYICTNDSAMLTFSAFFVIVAALVALVARV